MNCKGRKEKQDLPRREDGRGRATRCDVQISFLSDADEPTSPGDMYGTTGRISAMTGVSDDLRD